MPVRDLFLKRSTTVIDLTNSLDGAPGGGWPFTGVWQSCLSYSSLWTIVRSDQAGTLWFDFSMDGVDVDRSFSSPVTPYVAGAAQPFQTSPSSEFFRVRFDPDSVEPVSFKMRTYFSAGSIGPPLGPVSRGIAPTARSTVVRAALAGQLQDGTFKFCTVDDEGILQTNTEGLLDAQKTTNELLFLILAKLHELTPGV